MDFIPAERYYDIYLILVTLFSVINISKFNVYKTNKSDKLVAFIICTIFVIFLGTRPISPVFVDMPHYFGLYNRWSGPFTFNYDTQNLLFDNIECYLASIQFDPTLHYVLFAAIYYGCILIASNKFFPDNVTISFLCYCAAFSTFSYCVNGYKAGSAAALFLVALAYRNKVWLSILLGIISCGFHHSMIMVLCSYAVVLCFKNSKYYFVLWIFSFLCAATHITLFQNFFGNFLNNNGDEHGAGYLIGATGSGFRLDFILYSAMPILVGYYAIYKKNIESQMYNTLLNLYLMTNSMWMFCMYANFTNRIAYLSWFMYPIVLIYPLFKENWSNNQYKIAKKIAYAHLGFTIFMQVIYYGFLGLGN